MKRLFKYMMCLGLFGLTLTSCKSDDEILPGEISNVTAEPNNGFIVLRWETPEESNIRYIQVRYYDYLLKKDVLRGASAFADSVMIPDTRKKYGDYTFTIQPFSNSDTGGKIEKISVTSDAAPITVIYGNPEKLPLTVADLSTNAQEASEGPIANLLDDNTATFFHTSWSVSKPAPHTMTVRLNKEITESFRIYYAPRANANNKPIDFDLFGSMDGEDWFLIKNFTKEADNLPVTSTDTYTSATLDVIQPFKYIKFSVNKTNSGSVFWTMSEFKFFTLTKTIIDPEDPNVEI